MLLVMVNYIHARRIQVNRDYLLTKGSTVSSAARITIANNLKYEESLGIFICTR